ncbi:MAG: M20/M25/M40 family metallo-hydrolase [Bacillus sp. (in: Bacteria)]|nr:M20/M25/M40 family metallo-hydrolase [Bacillus sp. (in: firmicutes)]
MEKLYQYIEDNKETYISWLQELCRQPSISAHNKGIIETANLVESFLKKTGANTEKVVTSGNPIVFGEINLQKEKTLAFYNHYDVQPEDPIDQWETDPFSAVIKDGKLFARGVADNKGNLMARICAIHAYQQVYGDVPLNIKFVIDGEEEIGSVHTHEIAERYPEKIKPTGYIWESGYRNVDDSLQVRLGVKGDALCGASSQRGQHRCPFIQRSDYHKSSLEINLGFGNVKKR